MRHWDGRQVMQGFQRLVLCAAALAAGVWLLLRSLHTLAPGGLSPAPYLLAAAPAWAAAAALISLALCAAAIGLSLGQAWGWAAGSLAALAALGFAAALWWRGGGADWWALVWGAVLLLALTAPSAREAYLGRVPDEPSSL